jgi:hypothetical protein
MDSQNRGLQARRCSRRTEGDILRASPIDGLLALVLLSEQAEGVRCSKVGFVIMLASYH